MMACGRKIGPYNCCSVVCGDSVSLIKDIPSKAVQLTLTDPPYGIGEDYATFDDTRDSLRALVQAILPEVLRISDRALVTPGARCMWMYPEPLWTLSWVVPAGNGCNPWGFTCWHPVLAYGKDPYLEARLGSRPDTIIHTESAEKNGHPCPKPINLWTKLLVRGSVSADDIIFDPFGGSGTTAVAAKKTGRHFLLFEMEQRYCEIAERRLHDFDLQGSIFESKKKIEQLQFGK